MAFRRIGQVSGVEGWGGRVGEAGWGGVGWVGRDGLDLGGLGGVEEGWMWGLGGVVWCVVVRLGGWDDDPTLCRSHPAPAT